MRSFTFQATVTAAAFVVASAHAFGWGLNINQASASQTGGAFCEIRAADEVLRQRGGQAPASGVLLVTDKHEVQPGKQIRARILNFGPRSVRFGAEFKIQRYDAGRWTTDPSSPDGPWSRRAGVLAPGRAGGCYRFLVPSDQPRGWYRFVTKVTVGSQPRQRIGKFRVDPWAH